VALHFVIDSENNMHPACSLGSIALGLAGQYSATKPSYCSVSPSASLLSLPIAIHPCLKMLLLLTRYKYGNKILIKPLRATIGETTLKTKKQPRTYINTQQKTTH